MAEKHSATRGRPNSHGKRKSFAEILSGPHYWITVHTKSGRVVRIPVEGKSRKAAGKGKASRATVRPFKGTAGRDVAYRTPGQGGASKARGGMAPRSERPGYDRRNALDTALGRSPAESRAQLAMQARAKRALRPATAAKSAAAANPSRAVAAARAAAAKAPATNRTIAPRSERPGYDRRNALDTALGRDPAEVRRSLAIQARGKRALKPKTGDAAAKEILAARRTEAAKLRQFRAKRIAERAATGPGMEEIGGRYQRGRGQRERFDTRKNATPAYREFIKKNATPRTTPTPTPARSTPAPPPARPSVREQAAAKRAGKGDAETRRAALLERARERMRKLSDKSPDLSLQDRLRKVNTKKAAAEVKKIEAEYQRFSKRADIVRARLKRLGFKPLVPYGN